ncbi:MAG TPA: CARDB domain-containing protein [Dehalococcoidia bacterium]|nr:CARDB domain-containing protein [Dehalococcoidia bacterium]
MLRRFFSWTFVIGFGVGSFVGVALALLAVALAKPAPTVTESIIEITATPAPTLAPSAPTPTATPSVRTTASIEVRIGPGEAFAIIGSIDSDATVSVLGRDDGGDWVAISYPPGSAAKGWLPAHSLSGLSGNQVSALAVLVPTPFTRTLPTNASSDFPTTTPGFGATPGFGDTPSLATPITQATPQPVRTPTPATSGPQATPTPRPLHVGPTDLTVVGLSVTSDGAIVVSIGNAGPGDVSGSTIAVLVSDGSQSETVFVQPVLRAGETINVSTSQMRITHEADVTATIDPSNLLADIDRSNNQRYATLAPRPATSFSHN